MRDIRQLLDIIWIRETWSNGPNEFFVVVEVPWPGSGVDINTNLTIPGLHWKWPQLACQSDQDMLTAIASPCTGPAQHHSKNDNSIPILSNSGHAVCHIQNLQLYLHLDVEHSCSLDYHITSDKISCQKIWLMNMLQVPGLSPLAGYGSVRDIGGLRPIQVHSDPVEGYSGHGLKRRALESNNHMTLVNFAQCRPQFKDSRPGSWTGNIMYCIE